MSGRLQDWTCKHCGSSLELHQRERPGSIPGNAVYCSNDECRASLRAHAGRLKERLGKSKPTAEDARKALKRATERGWYDPTTTKFIWDEE